MMKVLIDTNVILDVLLKRTPFDVDAYNILKLAEEKKINAYLAAFSITDIYYFINKNLSHNESIKALEALLQMQCLRKLKGDLIITRDEKFQKITNKAISPKDFLSNKGLT
jgi:predicted nucleic acid-binding protein